MSRAVKFSALPINQAFRFDGPLPGNGPWRKISDRQCARLTDPTFTCEVGSVTTPCVALSATDECHAMAAHAAAMWWAAMRRMDGCGIGYLYHKPGALAFFMEDDPASAGWSLGWSIGFRGNYTEQQICRQFMEIARRLPILLPTVSKPPPTTYGKSWGDREYWVEVRGERFTVYRENGEFHAVCTGGIKSKTLEGLRRAIARKLPRKADR